MAKLGSPTVGTRCSPGPEGEGNTSLMNSATYSTLFTTARPTSSQRAQNQLLKAESTCRPLVRMTKSMAYLRNKVCEL